MSTNFYIHYAVDDDEVSTALSLEYYNGDDDGSWLLLEPTFEPWLLLEPNHKAGFEAGFEAALLESARCRVRLRNGRFLVVP